jgi:hypothetical protein
MQKSPRNIKPESKCSVPDAFLSTGIIPSHDPDRNNPKPKVITGKKHMPRGVYVQVGEGEEK